MNSDNFFDDDKTIYRDFDSGPEEEKLSFFIENNPENKIFLSSGISITIGRSIESDFFIENKTVSRNHLKLIRDKEQVKFEILGRNGLYLDNQLHTRSVITIRPPAVFRIGDVSCCLELESDEDETIIPASQPREKMPPPSSKTQPSQPNPSTPDPAPVPKPFDPSPIDTFIPSTTPDTPEDVHLHEQAAPVSDIRKTQTAPSPSPPERGVDSDDFGVNQNPIQEGHVQPPPAQPSNFDPIPQKKQRAYTQGNGQSPRNPGNTNKRLIAGIITIAIVILVLTGWIFFSGKSDKSDSVSDVSNQTTAQNMGGPEQLQAKANKTDPNQTRIDLANELINLGDYVAAKDVLKDIPKDSIYYAQALRLMEKVSEK